MMSQFAIKRPSSYADKVLRWNRCGFRWKGSRSKKKTLPSQDVEETRVDITESELYFPFINKDKTTNKDALSSLRVSPLSIHYSSKRVKNGERIYLDKFQSVTSILNQTKPANEFFALKNWQKAQISELGEEQFKEKRKTISRRGTGFHQEIQAYFKSNETISHEEGVGNSGYWRSISHVLQDIKNVVAVESAVVHPLLKYAGTLDLIAEYKGMLAVIDWKTSAKHKTNLKDCYSYPQQVVAYGAAVNYDDSYPFQVCNGVIVIAYENGDPADVHHLSKEMSEVYWLEWLMRLQQYKKKFPETGDTSANMDASVTEKITTPVHHFETLAKTVGAKSMSNIGVPLTQIGKTVKDEDVVEDNEMPSHEKDFASQEESRSSGFESKETWKTSLKDFIYNLFPKK